MTLNYVFRELKRHIESALRHHRQTPELILQKGRASFRITSGPPMQKDRGRNRLKGILKRVCEGSKEERALTHTLRITSRLKAHTWYPIIRLVELQPRIPQMSNQTLVEGSPNVQKSASERVREGMCRGFPQCTEVSTIKGNSSVRGQL